MSCVDISAASISVRCACACRFALKRLCCLQRYVFLPEYDRLAAEDKIKLLEQGCCPPAGLPGCSDMVLNFAIDWELLHPALQVAFDDMTQRHVLSRTVLDT